MPNIPDRAHRCVLLVAFDIPPVFDRQQVILQYHGLLGQLTRKFGDQVTLRVDSSHTKQAEGFNPEHGIDPRLESGSTADFSAFVHDRNLGRLVIAFTRKDCITSFVHTTGWIESRHISLQPLQAYLVFLKQNGQVNGVEKFEPAANAPEDRGGLSLSQVADLESAHA